jgi:DedD protein
MASPQTPDTSEIRRRGRQRLIGAVAIALLLIVFVPMMLDSEPRPARDEPKLEIPAKENAPALPAPKAEAPKKPAAPTAELTPIEPKAAPPKVAAVEPKPAEAKGSFAIQVGAFRDDSKLAQVRDKLTAANIKTYTEPSGELTRLRVGPFATRAEADKAVGAVRLTVPDAKVIPLN